MDNSSLLDRFGTFLKTDLNYLVRGFSWALLSQFIISAALLLFSLAVARYVPKVMYGEYKYVLGLVALLSTITLSGIGSAVFQSAAQGFNTALERGFWANMRWSLPFVASALLLALYYFFQGNSRLGVEILIGGALTPLIASASLFSPFLGGKKEFKRQALYGIIDNLIPIAALLTTILITENVLVLVAVYFLSNALAAVVFYARTKYLYAGGNTKEDPHLLSYSKHLSLMGILGGLADNLDQVLLFHFVGPVELAIYNFAIAIPNQVRGPAKGIASMLQARYVDRSAQEIKAGMANKMFWYLAFGIVGIVLYIFAAPLIFKFLFPQYLDAVWYSQIYIFSLIALVFDPAMVYISARKEITAQYIDYGFYSVSQILCMVIGVLYWGLLGLVLARVFARIAGGIVQYVLYRRAIKQELTHA